VAAQRGLKNSSLASAISTASEPTVIQQLVPLGGTIDTRFWHQLRWAWLSGRIRWQRGV